MSCALTSDGHGLLAEEEVETVPVTFKKEFVVAGVGVDQTDEPERDPADGQEQGLEEDPSSSDPEGEAEGEAETTAKHNTDAQETSVQQLDRATFFEGMGIGSAIGFLAGIFSFKVVTALKCYLKDKEKDKRQDVVDGASLTSTWIIDDHGSNLFSAKPPTVFHVPTEAGAEARGLGQA